MTALLAGMLIALVIVGVLVVLLWDNPIGVARAHRGLRYRVGRTERVVPDLQLTSSPPRLIRGSVLDRMGRLLEYADGVLTNGDIPYWISCGTLLGAVRHEGFIPWDDDIDVQIELSDRPRLLALRDRLQREGFGRGTCGTASSGTACRGSASRPSPESFGCSSARCGAGDRP